MSRHPSLTRLTQFIQGRLTRRQSRKMVRELLSGWPAHAAARAGAFDYAAAFQAAGRAVDGPELDLAIERAEAPELLREIAVQPFHRQWLLVTDHPRFRTWSFCGLLLDA